jgi:hypothetical protein
MLKNSSLLNCIRNTEPIFRRMNKSDRKGGGHIGWRSWRDDGYNKGKREFLMVVRTTYQSKFHESVSKIFVLSTNREINN